MSFGKETMFKIEGRAMLEGLTLVWDKRYRKIKIECDNALLIELCLFGGGAHSNLVELHLLHQLLPRKWKVYFNYISRDHNGIDDHMAKCTTAGDSLLHLFAEPPSSVSLLARDRLETKSFYFVSFTVISF